MLNISQNIKKMLNINSKTYMKLYLESFPFFKKKVCNCSLLPIIFHQDPNQIGAMTSSSIINHFRLNYKLLHLKKNERKNFIAHIVLLYLEIMIPYLYQTLISSLFIILIYDVRDCRHDN